MQVTTRDAVIALHSQGHSIAEICAQLSKGRSQVYAHLKSAAETGQLKRDPVMPGYRIARASHEMDEDGRIVREWVEQRPDHGAPFEVPAGHVVKGVSALLDADGKKIIEWVKTREGRVSPEEAARSLKEAFDGWTGSHVAAPAPEGTSAELLTLLPANDWHMGMFVWKNETGENWDLKIAERRIGDAVRAAVDRSPMSERFVVLGGGDLMHADNNENRTAKSGNQLDVDGRYPKVMQSAGRLMVQTVEAALTRAKTVEVRILPGNHDEHSSHAIAAFLYAWFRDDERVVVDLDPSLFWWRRWGSVMLGATHGHTVKIADMPQIMAHRRAAEWGATRFRYVHGFHLHHKRAIATEGNGCIAEVHQAPIPQDAWHFGAGFLSGRSIQTITYHQTHGEISRARVALLDG